MSRKRRSKTVPVLRFGSTETPALRYERRPKNDGRTPARRLEDDPALQAIWDVVAQIPRGSCATYGDVARAAGLPGRARQAGYALKHTPDGLHLPWHRVVGAGGRIVFPPDSAAFREQARRLRGDGVDVKNGRVPRSVLRSERLPGD